MRQLKANLATVRRIILMQRELYGQVDPDLIFLREKLLSEIKELENVSD